MDRCVNCGIATAGRCNTLRRRALDDKTTLSVIRQFLAPKPVEEASRICHNCWVAADRAAIHMSGPSSSSQGSFNKSDISGNTNQLGSVTTAVPKLQIQPPSKEPQLAAANTKLSVSDIEVQDQTKILVTKVYRYFEQESEELKKKSGDLDLTPLSNFRQRTALATGVSETTLQQILKEEEERNADKRQEPPQKRRAALKRRRQSDSEEPENSEIILPVEMKLEPSDGEISMNEEPEIFIPPVKVEPSDGDTDKEQTDPLSLDVKTESGDDGVDTPRHGRGPGARSRSPLDRPSPPLSRSYPAPVFTDYEEQPAPPSPSPLLPPPPPPAPRDSRRILQDDDVSNANYGSDAGSESGDDEDLGVVIRALPRELQTVLDTPLDEEYGDGDAVEAPAAAKPGAPAEPDSDPPTATDQPWRWYDFEWKDFPKSPIPPGSRRETFSLSNVGPTTPRVDPYDIFVDIWDRPIMEHIASETNKYAQQVAAKMLVNNSLQPTSRIKRWFETTVDELYVYFGIILAMGVVVKSRLDEYWAANSQILSTPGFSAHMSIDRFILLTKCLHFNDNYGMCGLNLEASEARLYKIQPILSHLNKKFQHMYTPGQNIALDESLLMWKGWLEIGQFIPNKAAKKGFKTYEVCESQTGYLWRFEVHAHKRSQLPPQQFEDPLEAPTPSIVLRLTQGLEHKGYTLWMDNFYNSPCLARRLKSLGFDCLGTLRTGRKFVPQVLHNLTKWNMRKGQIAGLTAGDVDVMVWRDSNRVATISTYHGNDVRTSRGSTKPTLILDYNIMMGGVDKKDQLLAMYPVERKRTAVWYKKLFRRLLNVSVLNSYIIHDHSSSFFSTTPLTHRNVRIQIIKSLLSRHHPGPVSFPSATPPPQSRRFDMRVHRLDEFELHPNADHARRPRRSCVVCKRRVVTFCVGCAKPLCMKNCFLAHHSS